MAPERTTGQRRVWINRQHGLRHRWPVYVAVLLLCLLGVAIFVLVLQGLQEPGAAQGTAPKVLG